MASLSAQANAFCRLPNAFRVIPLLMNSLAFLKTSPQRAYNTTTTFQQPVLQTTPPPLTVQIAGFSDVQVTPLMQKPHHSYHSARSFSISASSSSSTYPPPPLASSPSSSSPSSSFFSTATTTTTTTTTPFPPPRPPTSTGHCIPKPSQIVELKVPFRTSLGQELEHVKIKVECHGDPALPPSRTVVIFPSFSHSSHVASNLDDPSPGWWQEMVGPGKAIDTRHFRVLCPSVLGSPFSPTNPSSPNPRSTSIPPRPYRASFPQLSPTDLARCHRAVLDTMGVFAGESSSHSQATESHNNNNNNSNTLHAVIGSSLGGMQALQFASLYPTAVRRVIAIASTGRTTPFTVAIRRMQRRAILTDPGYHRGDYDDHKTGPWEGLKAARELGTIFYRSREEFDARFAWSPSGDRHFTSLDTWEVESYLAYAGAKIIRRYDPNAYLLLSKCMDLMDLGDGVDGRQTYAEGAGRIQASTLLIGVAQDALIPMNELQMLADTINAQRGVVGGGNSRTGISADAAASGSQQHQQHPQTAYPHHPGEPSMGATFVRMDSHFGHDAFLKDFPFLTKHIHAYLEGGIQEQLVAESVHNTGGNAP